MARHGDFSVPSNVVIVDILLPYIMIFGVIYCAMTDALGTQVSMQGSPIAQSCTCLVRLAALVAGYIEHLLHLIAVAAITLVSIAVVVSFCLQVGLVFFRTLLMLTNHSQYSCPNVYSSYLPP